MDLSGTEIRNAGVEGSSLTHWATMSVPKAYYLKLYSIKYVHMTFFQKIINKYKLVF